jgi:hypothetical protein
MKIRQIQDFDRLSSDSDIAKSELGQTNRDKALMPISQTVTAVSFICADLLNYLAPLDI